MDKMEVQKLIQQALLKERKQRFKRKIFLLAIGSLLAPAFIYAASIALPNRFTDGETLTASKLNDNFDAILAKANDSDAKIEKRLGIYCGRTAATYDGAQVGGYTGAKSKCETTCANTNAHMCTGHELAISMQLGVVPAGNGWYASGARADVGGGNYINDCTSWTVNSNNPYAMYWSSGAPAMSSCINANNIICCL